MWSSAAQLPAVAAVVAAAVLASAPGGLCWPDPPVFRVPLDSGGQVTFSWLLDYPSRRLQAEVHVRDDSNSSWFAVGFSDYGEAWPADYCVLWTDWRGVTRLQDAWAGPDGRLSVDEQQDCASFQFVRRRKVTKFAFVRSFDTCDDGQDYVIEEGTTHVVWARGRGPLFRLAGLDVAGDSTARGMQRAQLLKNTAPPAPHPEGTFTLEVMALDVKVPAHETTYWCHVHRLPDRLRDKHHVVQFEAAIQSENEGVVHHMEVFHCEAPPSQDMPEYRGPCFDPSRPPATQLCKRVLAAWAMGAPPFVYPEEAGLPIGGPDFNPYVMLEVHYNNPELRSGVVDGSGVRLYVSPTLRRYDGGVMELGLEYTDKMAIPPRQLDFPLSGYCIAECTAVGIPPDGIVIFGSQLHTHLTGSRVFTRHFRDGEELPEVNRDNHYSTHFQEIRLLKRPVRVLPGDALITTCWYRTKDRANITLGGFSISEEMCVNYVHYFPKIDLEVCKSSISDQALETYFRFLHEWDGQKTSREQGVSANYQAVEWTPMRARVLSEVYTQSPLSMQCNQSSGERFPGYWENLPATPELRPLPPPTRECATSSHRQ